MCAWDVAFETETTQLVARVVAGDGVAWRALMVNLAPHLETWARGNRTLRRCRLAGDDDARTVMVDVLERLAVDDHGNLKRFLAREIDAPAEDELIDEVMRLARLDEDELAHADDTSSTPLRAWLLNLLDFVARDHVRRRLGWVKGVSKRDVNTDAARLDAAPEPAARPPLTDQLTVSRLVAEVRDYLMTFPPEMREAVLLWLDDVAPAEIATRLELDDAGRARALVRAGQARLRERFRGRSPLLFT